MSENATNIVNDDMIHTTHLALALLGVKARPAATIITVPTKCQYSDVWLKKPLYLTLTELINAWINAITRKMPYCQ